MRKKNSSFRKSAVFFRVHFNLLEVKLCILYNFKSKPLHSIYFLFFYCYEKSATLKNFNKHREHLREKVRYQ